MTRIVYLVLFVGLAASATACSDSLPLSSEASDLEAGPAVQTGIIAYGRPDLGRASDMEGLGELDEQFAALRSSVLTLIKSDEPLASRVRRVQRFLEMNEASAASHYVEQFAAVLLLRELLQTEEEELDGSISYCVEILTRNGSPEAPLVLEALKRLRPHWVPAKTSQAAKLTAERGLSWVERLCTGCNGNEGLANGSSLQDPMIVEKSVAITAAAEELRKMASP